MISVDYLVLADAASVADGKLYIHGAGWDVIRALSFPAAHPLIAVAIRLRVPWADTNQRHTLELDAVDADGQSILPEPPGPLVGETTVGRPAFLGDGDEQVFPLAFQIQRLTFNEPGTYAVIFRIDGFEVARSPFKVIKIG
jgi:hypothetical protein